MEQLHAYDCHQNVTEPQATEYHKISTHVYNTGTVSQHTLQVVEMAWTDDSTLVIFFYMRYQYPRQHRKQESGRGSWGECVGEANKLTHKRAQ